MRVFKSRVQVSEFITFQSRKSTMISLIVCLKGTVGNRTWYALKAITCLVPLNNVTSLIIICKNIFGLSWEL